MRRLVQATIFVAVLAFASAGLAPVSSLSAQGRSDSIPGKPERLFRSRDPLEMTLRGPLVAVFKDRDTMSTKTWPAVIELVDGARGALQIPVTLATRGHFRLQRAGCSVPPLKVMFAKESAKSTIFNDQKSLKLVTHCRNDVRYEQDLLVEERAYRIYNALTPLSHRTRVAQIRYVPAEDSTKSVTRYGFFLEDDDDMAKRNGAKLLMQTGASFSDMEPGQIDLVALFEYMIGNTDWSVFAIHNIRVIEGRAGYYPVAYDFDFSGLVGASYAAPDERLPIKSVRTRLYRGPCRRIAELIPTIETFNNKREAIYAALTESPVLSATRIKDAVGYLDGFFKEIAEPKAFEDALGYACRGR